MKAILNPDGTFRGLVTDDTVTDPQQTRVWVFTDQPNPDAGFRTVEGAPAVSEIRVTQTWSQEPLPKVPATKLTIKRRVTPEEWAALNLVLDQNPAIHEDWDLANEIDPAHPSTAGVLAMLYGGGILTTPDYVIFAP